MIQAGGFAAYWAQGDSISRLVMLALLAMSLLSWYFILSKAWSAWRARGAAAGIEAFWESAGLEEAVARLRSADPENLYAALAANSAAAAAMPAAAKSLNAESDRGELITRTLRRDIHRASARLESGLTILASIGATAPFVGLLGTVWGIYHALAAVSMAGTVQIDKVAGPVGEALVMTALGLTVAIPAVLAYNAFTRLNRVTLAEMDAFAHDLHAHLTTGARVAKKAE